MLVDRVRQFVRQHDLARATTRVVAALSGGSDSVALLHVLRELHAAGDLQLAGAAHFNHQLRAAAGRDEAFAAACAAATEVGLLAGREDVAARARAGRQSLEAAAREARYEFFERARAHFGADVVALGHTRDDQAETFLLRLIRGAGPRGLSGMHPRHGPIVRPLLDCSRAELRVYLEARHLAFVEDETNADLAIPRNRIRAELLPFLERFNPGIAGVLADEAHLARETWEWMEQAGDDAAAGIVRRPPGPAGPELDVAGLLGTPAALRRVILWRAMNEVAAPKSVAFGHVEAALGLVGDLNHRAVDVPGLRVHRNGPVLVLTGRPAGAVGHGNAARPDQRGAAGRPVRYALPVPGMVELPEAGCSVSAEPGAAGGVGRAAGAGDAGDNVAGMRTGHGSVARVRGDLCGDLLAVRHRRPGDRFRPVGLGGDKKLQDYFVDRKVARARRDLVPLVVDGNDRIVWVAGYGIDEAFQVTDASQGVLILKLMQA